MSSTIKNCIISFSVIILSFFGGYLCRTYTAKPEIKIVKQTETVYETKWRDYSKLDFVECARLLKKYDTDPIWIEGKLIDKTTLRVKTGLCERTAEKEFTFESTNKSDWKITGAFCVLGLAAGGYTVYKLK